MQSRKLVLFIVALLVIGAGWYAFRPERLWVNQSVHEDLSGTASAASMSAMASPALIAAGTFHSGAHETKGMASIYSLPNGERVLRLTGFETSNGPDVHVLLVAAGDAKDNATVTKAGFVDLATLKGNIGDQNYDLPRDLDLSRYGSVTIWCKRFGVNFGTAPIANRS